MRLPSRFLGGGGISGDPSPKYKISEFNHLGEIEALIEYVFEVDSDSENWKKTMPGR